MYEKMNKALYVASSGQVILEHFNVYLVGVKGGVVEFMGLE